MMQVVEKEVDSEFYGYVNGDIILSQSVFALLSELLTNKQAEYLLRAGVSDMMK